MEKKKKSLESAIAILGVLCIALLIALVVMYSNHTSIVNRKNSEARLHEQQIISLQDQKSELELQVLDIQDQLNQLQSQTVDTEYFYKIVDDLNSQKSYLESRISNLLSQASNLQSQISDLQSQINTLKSSKLIKVNITTNDSRPFLGTPYLQVSGEICNVGTNTAYNAKLHVILLQGTVIAIDKYILLGTIYGESYTVVDEKVYYNGSSLTGWQINPEWE